MSHYFAEYVWLDGNNNFRSKTKIISNKKENRFNITSYPHWNYDGSSTNQATLEKSEVNLEPYFIYPDVFRDFNFDVIVMCTPYKKENGKIIKLSKRYEANHIFTKNSNLEPLFGLEQEFFMIDKNTKMPFNYTSNSTDKNTYYCGVGADNVNKLVRTFMNQAMLMCVKAGIILTGMNMEVSPGQGELQVCNMGIHACDDLILLRYILVRLGEDYNMIIDFSPKLECDNKLNGSGCHINFSTNQMRDDNGYDIIKKSLDKLNLQDTEEHLTFYGTNNIDRLTGKNETSKYNEFTVGEGNRGCSIRIPYKTIEDKKGYFEDRRPGGNIDPYTACLFLFNSIL